MTNEERLKKIENKVSDIVKFDEAKEAFDFYRELKNWLNKKNFQKSNLKIYREYEKELIKLQWVALPFFNQDDVKELFNNHFQRIFEMEYFDLWGKFKKFLLTIILHEDRDKFKAEIKKILERNKGVITSKRLKNGKNPTVENWLREYISKNGIGIVESIDFQKFFIDSENIKNLDQKDKDKLRMFLEFYERLKLSSLSAAGVEETIPVDTPEFQGQIRDGRLEKEVRLDPGLEKIFNAGEKDSLKIEKKEISQPPTNKQVDSISSTKKTNPNRLPRTDELQQMAEKYPPGSLERKAIEEEMKRIEGGK